MKDVLLLPSGEKKATAKGWGPLQETEVGLCRIWCFVVKVFYAVQKLVIFYQKWAVLHIMSRPGVAGAVLQTALLVIKLLAIINGLPRCR